MTQNENHGNVNALSHLAHEILVLHYTYMIAVQTNLDLTESWDSPTKSFGFKIFQEKVSTLDSGFIMFRIPDVSVKQGWRSGESSRPPSIWPVCNFPTYRHMWTEFLILYSALRGFSPGSPVFPSH